MTWLFEPWPWYVSGPLIGLMVPTLLLLSGKSFGVSTSFQHVGAMCTPRTNLSYLKNYDWRNNGWLLFFVGGILLGAYMGVHWLSANAVQFLPNHYYSFAGVITLAIGGLMVGFGTRYAEGCTSGHSIMGLSNLQWVSLVATISFFIGGLVMTHIIAPFVPFLGG
ncbi:MAG: YeeE/YedE thiosulfate transporter family protein [Chloroflexota bacterium]